MKRNAFLLWSNILNSFFLVTLLSYLFCPYFLSSFLEMFKSSNVFEGQPLKIFMLVGAIVLLVGLAASWVFYIQKKEKFYIISMLVCLGGQVLTMWFFAAFIPSVILAFIGYRKMKS